jgi:pimeloyl-ACP methyl ester carboxylesterase
MPYATVNGVDLYHETTGEGDPLVLVHGGWSDHRNWQFVVPALAEAYRVTAYDRRAHSRSERPAVPPTRRVQEDDLAALIEELHGDPAHVVGTSFGGSIGLGLATRRPDLVRSVSVHEPPLMSLVADDAELGPMFAETNATLSDVIARVERGDVEGGTRQFVEEIALGPGAWDVLPEEIRETGIRNAPAFVGEQCDPEWASIDPSALARLEVPVQLTEGDQSPPWFPAIVAALAESIDGAQVRTFAGAGHAPHLTHAEDFVASLSVAVTI